MSDAIKHECGVALIRLRKPYQYFIDKYQTPLYAAYKLSLMMEKQVNRGQDGAGVANIKMEVPPGKRYISRYRSVGAQPTNEIFKKVHKKFRKALKGNKSKTFDAKWLQENVAFTGELWLGHLRYGTHGANEIENCHPMLRQSNWRSRNLVMAGNFNMTNVDQLFNKLVSLGQHPKDTVDTVTVMEKIGHFLDEENQRVFDRFKGIFENPTLSDVIEDNIDIQRVLHRSCRDFDGGYVMSGLLGHGAAFVIRDPSGIRPAFYHADDEVVVVASEKQAIKAAFNVDFDEIRELTPGSALIIDKYGGYSEVPILPQREKRPCSFERIYFSRATDPDIYNERKMLGKLLIPQILKEINYDLENTIFSYIPNTAETAFFGMIDGLEEYLYQKRKQAIVQGILFEEELDKVLSFRPRIEKLVAKDVKSRTFITADEFRDEMVSNVYDTTYEVVRKGVDTVVVIDDSIVRGTTLEKKILKMLDRLGPKKIVIVSSAPQIRYPDCYGIDMSKMQEFVAFRAMLKLLEENDMNYLKEETYTQCVSALASKNAGSRNITSALYEPFTYEEISEKIAGIIRPDDLKAELSVVYQTVENLHAACPEHKGDWYFTGNYPTEGGNRTVNRAFVNFYEGRKVRAY
ncbi:amidophosphoribosyltransferase [Ravibacter arvi]|uniref:Amidophosphoribosyltransferase n=1 Tax=Ravibacter arvi TaxID=2051041 RepID=A0ABP8MBV1_9BACT